MDILTNRVYQESIMNTLATPINQQQLMDMVSSIPKGAELSSIADLRHGQCVNAYKDGVTYVYRGESIWEPIRASF